MQVRRKYSGSGNRGMTLEHGLVIALMSIASLASIPTVRDHLSSTVTNMVLNLNAS